MGGLKIITGITRMQNNDSIFFWGLFLLVGAIWIAVGWILILFIKVISNI